MSVHTGYTGIWNAPSEGGPTYSSYVEAWKVGANSPRRKGPSSRASTEERYSYGPAGSAQRLRKSKNFVDGGDPLPAKPISVLHRPKGVPPSLKNAENLDAQHQRDVDAFERRANGYRRLAQQPYHHNAPPGSILTTFEQGHIVDRGRGKSDLHESRGVYDPVAHSFRVPPAAPPTAASLGAGGKPKAERPISAPHSRGYADMHAAKQTHHDRPTTPFEHRLLQATRGTYNPLTHEYRDSPEPDYVNRKEREFERNHGLGHGLRRTQPTQAFDPITGESKPSPGPAAAASSPAPAAAPSTAAAAEAHGTCEVTTPGGPSTAAPPRPTTTPNSAGALRKSMAGPSWGTYNPITHEWAVPPRDPKFAEQESLTDRKLGVSGHSAGRTQTPGRQGVYNPILNTWTVPPADPRVMEGLAFKPATLFSRPTPATIRM
ncbi:hypothetical protein HYH03_014442 [Edaphochlamys debaryana]|uniref:Uncharacterized protein n=1 Tax=Edaphochlamys debaryana TaxID=47281 RepID=A0A835XNT1_9CHLO|nr:hypothetical protein HYH03_014442 [Edaphochlamys debaryana]|eukprot:KAG2486944.1 hypothetical protein HYH03_014442 [Edaphochlamys debaryana]